MSECNRKPSWELSLADALNDLEHNPDELAMEQHAILYAADTIAQLQEQVEGLEDTLTRIGQWCEAYPINIFPEPDWKNVREVLDAGGISLDSVSASNMRYVVVRIAEMIPPIQESSDECAGKM